MARNPKKTQTPKESVAVIADGQTEQWYLQLLLHHHQKRVTLKPELTNKTIKDQYELVIELVKKYDKVLWIIDLDVTLRENKESNNPGLKLNQFKEYYEKTLKKWSNKVTIIINNPCLEYWFILHDNDNATKYYPRYRDLKPDLRKFNIDNRLFKEYDKKEKDYKAGKGIYKKLLPYLLKMDFSKLKTFNIDKSEEESCSEMYKIFNILNIDLSK